MRPIESSAREGFDWSGGRSGLEGVNAGDEPDEVREVGKSSAELEEEVEEEMERWGPGDLV